MTTTETISMLHEVPTSGVLSLLVQLGYIQKEEIPGRGFIFASENGDELVIPLNKKFSDFGRNLFQLLGALTTDLLSFDDLLVMLSIPGCDVYQHKFQDDLAKWGSLPLYALNDALPALSDLIKFTAAGVLSPRLNFARAPVEADVFNRQCRCGQTQRSSYVIKVFCPLRISDQAVGYEGDEPFGRQVTQACVENLSFLNEEGSDLPGAMLPATMNRNVANAIARLRPMSFRTDAAATVWFSAAAKREIPSETVNIREFTFVRADAIQRRLSRTDDFERMAVRGFVVDLHKDRPKRNVQISHTITMEIRRRVGYRKLDLSLMPRQYRDALRWNDQNVEVIVDALIDRTKRPWQAVELYDITPLNSAQTELFPEPPLEYPNDPSDT